jgi:hypothetical protein
MPSEHNFIPENWMYKMLANCQQTAIDHHHSLHFDGFWSHVSPEAVKMQ